MLAGADVAPGGAAAALEPVVVLPMQQAHRRKKPRMPHFRGALDERDVEAIVAFLGAMK